MATNKSSFLLYRDIVHTVKKLSNNDAGELFKHILLYVNDENPTTENVIVDIAFEPIKQSLKRDLKRYELIIEKRSLAGKASAESKKQNQQVLTSVETVQQTSTKSTVSDSVIVSVIDIEKKNKRKTKVFSPPTILEVVQYFKENGYTENSGERAFKFYNVADWIDSKGNKVLNWKQKMQSVWFKDENKSTTTINGERQKPKLAI